ncbi:MAG TPA: LLM class flavin-dependent oxidoreductase [Thermoleophilaceae bacterium]|nr:LLM class flavin-dependent oxidoreductase [Thermoleophilaceae bacterium]
MDIGIGLPATIPGVTGDQFVDWSRRAETAGFSTLGTIDRLVYPNYEPLVALAAAAAVTERIRLTTAIAILPYRANAALVAKQAATVHTLSGGRLVFGAAVGGREDDYEASGVPLKGRGKVFEAMLREITEVWGGAPRGLAGGIGPSVQDDPPQLILGGQVDATFRRAAKYGDGWMAGGGPPERFPAALEKLEAAFREAGRVERPRALALQYYALGDDPEGDITHSIRDYYAFAGEYAEMLAAAAARTPEALRERVKQFKDAGCQELIWFPTSSDPVQVDLLAEALL